MLELTTDPQAKAGMLIRKEPAEVFLALADPEITSRIWFTRSSGKMVAGATLRWEWEMYGVSSEVTVLEVEENRRIRFTWSGYVPERPTTVEFRFTPMPGGHTYLEATESGFTGTADERVAYAIDSTGGFTFLVSSVKALLEHGIELGLVGDAHPSGAPS